MTEEQYREQLNIWIEDVINMHQSPRIQDAVNIVLVGELFKLKKQVEEIKNER